jgi:hypothetical protein
MKVSVGTAISLMREKRRGKHSDKISSFFCSTTYIIGKQYLPAGGAEVKRMK